MCHRQPHHLARPHHRHHFNRYHLFEIEFIHLVLLMQTVKKKDSFFKLIYSNSSRHEMKQFLVECLTMRNRNRIKDYISMYSNIFTDPNFLKKKLQKFNKFTEKFLQKRMSNLWKKRSQ